MREENNLGQAISVHYFKKVLNSLLLCKSDEFSGTIQVPPENILKKI